MALAICCITKTGASDGNRTRVSSLGSYSSTIELHSHKDLENIYMIHQKKSKWNQLNSNFYNRCKKILFMGRN